MRSAIAAIIVSVSLFALAACQRADVVGAEGATVGDVERTATAVRLVLVDEGAMVATDRVQGVVRVIEARYPDGTEVTFDVEALSTTTSHVTVQIGHFGNARENARLLDAVKVQVRELKDEELRKARRVR